MCHCVVMGLDWAFSEIVHKSRLQLMSLRKKKTFGLFLNLKLSNAIPLCVRHSK